MANAQSEPKVGWVECQAWEEALPQMQGIIGFPKGLRLPPWTSASWEIFLPFFFITALSSCDPGQSGHPMPGAQKVHKGGKGAKSHLICHLGD